MKEFRSQIGQDKFVVDVLKGKRNGTFCPGPEFHKENQHATRVATDKETKWKNYST